MDSAKDNPSKHCYMANGKSMNKPLTKLDQTTKFDPTGNRIKMNIILEPLTGVEQRKGHNRWGQYPCQVVPPARLLGQCEKHKILYKTCALSKALLV